MMANGRVDCEEAVKPGCGLETQGQPRPGLGVTQPGPDCPCLSEIRLRAGAAAGPYLAP